jgi:hypothetical protein
MALFEIVLRFSDHDEVRLTDRDGWQMGDELTIAHRRFVVTAAEEPELPGAQSRLILEPVEQNHQ